MKLMKWPGTSTLKKIVRAFSDSFSICCMIWAQLSTKQKKLLYTDINEYNYFIKRYKKNTIDEKCATKNMFNCMFQVQFPLPSSSRSKEKYIIFTVHTLNTRKNTFEYLIEGLVYQSGWIRCKCKQGSTKVPFYDLVLTNF